MTYRLARAAIVAAAIGALALAWDGTPTLAQAPALACGTDTRIDMRLLVVSADGNEPALPAIRAALDYIGAPHDLYVASQNPGGLVPAPGQFIPARLATACRAHYQGVILTSGDLGYFPPTRAMKSFTEDKFVEGYRASYQRLADPSQGQWPAHEEKVTSMFAARKSPAPRRARGVART